MIDDVLEPTKIYLAARYEKYPEMREFRNWLEDKGFIVTSRWIDHETPAPFPAQELALAVPPALAVQHALEDIEDVKAANWLICFSVGGGGKGGRHVELGLAIDGHKRLTLIGPREHVFHCIPQLEVFPDLETFKQRADLD
jgi:hypothetical protein